MRVILDGDVLIYQAAHQSGRKHDWGDGKWSYHGDVNEGITRMHAYFHDLEEKYPEAEEIIFTVSGPTSENFRYDIFPDYKKGRHGDPFKRPPHFSALRDASILEFSAVIAPSLEADDVIGLLAKPNDVVVSIDKDLLTIPARHLNLRDLDSPEKVVHEVEAERFFYKQCLMGDPVDGIPGIRGVGPVGADKILDNIPSGALVWPFIVAAYEKKGMSETEALMNARLVRILRPGEYDWDNDEVKMWQPLS